jgi:CheY-like chemotaxis protein
VLLVEDELTIAVTLRDDLCESGYDVTLVGNGNDAIARLEASHFDAVISDLHLPGANGLAVLECASLRHPDARLLLVTAYAADEHTDALRAVRGSMLPKPFENDAVIAWLRAGRMR